MVTIITDIRVPADAFPLGRLFQAHPDVEVELERLIPTQETLMPLFWVTADDEHEHLVAETLRDDPLVTALDELTRTPKRILYAVSWHPDINALVTILVDLGVDVVRATGTADAWEFRLQFANRAALTQFRERCRDKAIDLTLVNLYNPMMPPEKGPLVPEQYDVLATAYRSGYWDVPKGTDQAELATLIGVSETTLSERLRTGIKLLVEKRVYGPAGDPFD